MSYMLIRSSFMWDRFYNKYKQDLTERPVEEDDEIRTGVVATDISSYITKKSAAAASAFVSASRKKRRIKNPAEGSQPLVSKQGSPSKSSMSSSSSSGSGL
jgi:hypothetical protein